WPGSGDLEIPRHGRGRGGKCRDAEQHDKTAQQPEPLVGLILRVGHCQAPPPSPRQRSLASLRRNGATTPPKSHPLLVAHGALPLAERCSGRLLLRTFAGEAREEVVTTAG